MCLAVPTQVLEILKEDQVIVGKGSTSLTVSSSLLTDIKVGDYVLVHAGFAIEKITPDEAKEKIDAFDELDALYGDE